MLRLWRILGLISLATNSAACASSMDNHVTLPSEQLLIARLVASREIDVFEGDVQSVAWAHVLQPVGAAAGRLEVIGRSPDCPGAGRDGRLFVFALQRQRLHIAIRSGETRATYKDLTDLVIVRCALLDEAVAFGLS